ncbi:CPBP family intramembrane glutamic endopeptidase [Sphingosinicella sp. BN140058]|uniref:CPBP family intramembrane glutamic endopeptidase n=1 Tax=Sphingosinicella sp. BN140058 TaxID=1892855 RepID=UPI001011D7FE|nr:CPBP family intramembrane glutamic endopeptidase [Sphingosinicella sp. BN140058]QAY75842.1 CPBP family intramembrane metalloprotease [Sphingosinicella sp. BN140058]
MNMNPAAGSGQRPIVPFLALVAAATVLLTLLLIRIGDPRGPAAMLLMLAIMWTPALAAFATRLRSARTLRGFGWGLGPACYLGIAYGVTFAIVAIPFLIAIAGGHGTVTMIWWPKAAGNWGLPATPLAGFLMLASVNVLFAMIAAVGEELGWRGYLVPALAVRHRLPAITAITWAVTLLYHLPAMIGADYRSATAPLWFSIACFAAMLLPLCAFMAWLRLRSGSVWPCVLAHGAHNSFAQEMWPSAVVPDALTPWLVGEFGALTPLVALLAVGALVTLAPFQPGSRAKPSRASTALT